MAANSFLPLDANELAKYPAKSSQTSYESPWPLRVLTHHLANYLSNMPVAWVEAQVVEFNPRPGAWTQFFVIRDLSAQVSMPARISAKDLPPTLKSGDKVVVHATPSFYPVTGQLSLAVSEVRIQGIGVLLAQIEELRKRLGAEGLFANDRKQPLPFLPRKIGIVCGRNAKAQADVVENVNRRWPGAQFAIIEGAVQGADCVRDVCRALAALDSDPQVDVIVVTRGGGSVEDLLPFSDEQMVRAVAACSTPVVSAIGHEEDCPLLDLVADYRASTPTDAARRIVPDAQAEAEGIANARGRLRQLFATYLGREEQIIAQLRSRPVLAQPGILVDNQLIDLVSLQSRLRASWRLSLESNTASLSQTIGALRALSPLATLKRGYSVIRNRDGEVISDVNSVSKGARLEAVLANGLLGMEVIATLNSQLPQASVVAEQHLEPEAPLDPEAADFKTSKDKTVKDCSGQKEDTHEH